MSGISIGIILTVAFLTAFIAFLIERRRRLRAELAVRAGRTRYETQFLGIPVPTITWQRKDDDFTLVDFNDAAVKWTQGGIKAFLGKTLSELYQNNHIDIVTDIHKCFKEKTNIHKCFWYTTISNGSKHFLDVTYTYIPEDLVLVHTNDITDRKRAEENLQQAQMTLEQRVSLRTMELQQTNSELTQEIQRRRQAERDLRTEHDKAQYCIDNVSAIIVGLDKYGNINLINRLACTLLERTEKDMMGENWFNIAFTPDIRHETFATFRRAMTDPLNTMDYYENTILSRSGRQYLVAWKNSILRDAKGEFVGTLSVGEDITERRKAEELFRARQAEVAHFARIASVGEMATALTHELSQPLTVINIYAGSCLQLLNSGEDHSQLREALEQIAQQGQRAASIIQNLRQYLSKGKSERKIIDINNLVRQTGEIALIDAKNANIKIHYDLSNKLPPIKVDPVQIEQVIVNLLYNSLQALLRTPENNRHVWVQTKMGNDAVEVVVSDNGQGIAAADMEKIFEPFYSKKPDGMGLGLAISRSIIDAHEGNLKACNVPQGGATFSFTLPTGQTSYE